MATRTIRGRLPRVGFALACLLFGLLGLWVAIHRVPWLGPVLAETARKVVGPTVVARVEDGAYALDDGWNRVWRNDEAPESYWTVAPTAPAEPENGGEGREGESAAPQKVSDDFTLQDLPPVEPDIVAEGDGRWVPVEDVRAPGAAPVMYKTLMHPDRRRAWASVAVVAVDLKQVDLHLVAGKIVPEATEPEAAAYERKAIIPERDHEALLAAFNGGFRTIHGQLGMNVDGVSLVPPRDFACTVARHRNGGVSIRTWSAMADSRAELLWWRQTPICLAEDGAMNPRVVWEKNVDWGSAVDGSTIIRRSAIGIDPERSVLFVGMGKSSSAQAMAVALQHAGAKTVAQLDVNWSLPKFLFYEPKERGSSRLVARPLCPYHDFSEDEYVYSPSARDFFYLTRVHRAGQRAASTP